MANMRLKIKKEYKNHTIFIGLIKNFQWFGFLISTDNPLSYNEYFLFEFRFLFIKIWYTYDFK